MREAFFLLGSPGGKSRFAACVASKAARVSVDHVGLNGETRVFVGVIGIAFAALRSRTYAPSAVSAGGSGAVASLRGRVLCERLRFFLRTVTRRVVRRPWSDVKSRGREIRCRSMTSVLWGYTI